MVYGLIITWFPINSDAAKTLYGGGGGHILMLCLISFVSTELTSLNLI